jgi:hypothetical protein
MMLAVACGQLVEPDYEVATTYVFGDFEDLEELTLDVDESPGFIELSFDGYELSIDLVRRPSHIPLGDKFCTSMLPAAVADFISTIMGSYGFHVTSIERMEVFNIADNPMAACRCYARVMVNMGFALINGKLADSDSIPELCEWITKSTEGVQITGKVDGGKSVEKRLPLVTPIANGILQTAEMVTRLRPIGAIRQ